MNALTLLFARMLAPLLVVLLGIPWIRTLGERVVTRMLGRIGVFRYLAGRNGLAFSRRLLAEIRRKRERRELSDTYLRGWVAALLVQSWRGGRRRRAATNRDGTEPPAFAILSPGAACNLRCRHCYAATDHIPDARLRFDELDRVLSACDRVGTGLATISGGEPLLWRDGDRGVLDLAAAHPELLLIVYTNATQLSTEVADRMRQLGNVLPLVSIEGLAAQTDAVRGAGVHAQVVAAMGRLRAAGVLFGVSVTATADNADVLASGELLREVVDGAGASFAWVLDLANLGRASAAANALSPAARDAVQDALERQVAEHDRLVVSFLHTERSSTGCFGADRFDGLFYLDWAGQVRRCVYLPEPSIDATAWLASAEGCDALLAEAARLPACPLAPRDPDPKEAVA